MCPAIGAASQVRAELLKLRALQIISEIAQRLHNVIVTWVHSKLPLRRANRSFQGLQLEGSNGMTHHVRKYSHLGSLTYAMPFPRSFARHEKCGALIMRCRT